MGVWLTKQVYGGIAQGDQIDKEATFAFSKNINFRRKHDVVTLNQKLSKDSAVAVDSLPHWIKDLNGTVYAYTEGGKIFQRIQAASWVSVKTVSSSTGQGLGVDSSYLYYVNASYVGRFPIGGTWGVDNTDAWQAITASSWNPVKNFANVNLLCVGSNDKLAVYDPAAAAWSGTRLTMPAGWKIRDLEEWGDYLAISLWTGSAINKSSSGKVVLWDGLSDTFNAIMSSQAGNILLTQTDKNNLNVHAGVIGNIYRANAGELYQMKKVPFVNESAGDWIDIYPGSKTNWNGVPLFGVAGLASSASCFRGVYSYGSDTNGIPAGMNMEYTISQDSGGTAVKVGGIHAAASNELYVGWADGSTYGIDKLDNTAQYASGYLDTLQFHGSLAEEGYLKTPTKVHMSHLPLASGQSIAYKVRRDYNASFATVVTSQTYNSVDEQTTQLTDGGPLPSGRVFQGRVELTSVAGVAPSLLSVKTNYVVKETS